MKSSTIYSDKDGVLRVVTVEVPKEPIMLEVPRGANALWGKGEANAFRRGAKEYKKALQHCKDTSVPFDDINDAAVMIYKHYRKGDIHQQAQFNIKPDTFYTVPEFEYVFTAYGEVINDPHLWKKEFVFARLVSHQQEKVSDVSKLLGEDHIPQVIKFLLGAGTLDGLWWHEKPTDGRAPFWWRKYLLELYNKPSEQDKLWDEAEEYASGEVSQAILRELDKSSTPVKVRVHHVIDALKEKFTITRNQ